MFRLLKIRVNFLSVDHLNELMQCRYILEDDFTTTCRCVLECLECNQTSITSETYILLPVPLSVDSQSSIDLFLVPEHLSRDGGWRCSSCHRPVEANKTYIFEELPKILILQLKRFHQRPDGQYTKSTVPVIPNPEIDVSTVHPQTNVINVINYSLNATIHHSGNFQAGHYTASVLQGNDWLYCNDSAVDPINFDEIDIDTIYVLVYKRDTVRE